MLGGFRAVGVSCRSVGLKMLSVEGFDGFQVDLKVKGLRYAHQLSVVVVWACMQLQKCVNFEPS